MSDGAGGDAGGATAGGSAPTPGSGGASAPSSTSVPIGSPPAGVAPPVQTAPTKLKRELTIDGQKQTLEMTEDELWTHYNLGTTAKRRMEEAAKLRKEADADKDRARAMFEKMQKGDLLALQKELNPDFDEQEWLTSQLEAKLKLADEMQDPRTKELLTERQKREKVENELNQIRQQQAAEKRQQEVEHELEQISGVFTDALKLVKLPINDETLRMMARQEEANRQLGYQLSPQELAQETEKMAAGQIEAMLANSDDDTILDRFPTLSKRIHKAILGRWEKRQAGQQQQPPPVQKAAESIPGVTANGRPKLLNSKEEADAYGIKGLRTI